MNLTFDNRHGPCRHHFAQIVRGCAVRVHNHFKWRFQDELPADNAIFQQGDTNSRQQVQDAHCALAFVLRIGGGDDTHGAFAFRLLSLFLRVGAFDVLQQQVGDPLRLRGIYFCIGLAKILGKNPYTEKFFSLVGKESFHIMALHFLGFKIVDRIYSSVYGITDAEKIGKFPHSDYGLHISYVIAGVLIPLCLITLLRKVQKYGHFVKEM